MRRIEAMFETAAQAVLEAVSDLVTVLAARQQPDAAPAYAEVRDPEDLIEAEQRAAIIRERMRREGLLG